EAQVTAGFHSAGDGVFEHFVLRVEGAGSARQPGEVDAMAASVVADFESFVHLAAPLHALPDPGFGHEIDCALLQHPGPDGAFDVFAGAGVDDDRVDAVQV